MTRLLIATQHTFGLWDGKFRVIQKRKGVYFGISWDEHRIFVASRAPRQVPAVQIFDKSLALLDSVPFTDIGDDPHQLFYWEGCLYLANRDRFRIECYDFINNEESFIKWTPEGKDDHINSVWHDDNFFYVVEHRRHRMPKVIRIFNDDWRQVAKLVIFLKPQLGTMGFGIHNVYVEGKNVLTLAPDQIVTIHCNDIGPGLQVHRTCYHNIDGPSKTPYYRGLAKSQGVYFVGVSQLAAREQRDRGTSFVYMLDSYLGLLDVIELPNAGQIASIRAVDGIDLAHNRIPCPIC